MAGREQMHPAVKALLLRENTAQRTAEWYKLRKGMLTASDVATALGQNPYKSRAVLLRDKCCPDDRTSGDSTATRWGNQYEDEAIALYSERTGRRVLAFGLFQSLEYPWLGGSPDGVTTDGLLIEIKWYGFTSHKGFACLLTSSLSKGGRSRGGRPGNWARVRRLDGPTSPCRPVRAAR